MSKALAFIKKGFLIETRYKFHLLFRFARIIVMCAIYYYLAQLIDASNNPLLEFHTGNYFTFIIVGIAFFAFFRTGLSAYTDEIVRAMNIGTLEAMMVTPTKPFVIILFPSFWKYLLTMVEVILYLLLGYLLFGVRFSNPNLFGAFFFLVLMLISFSGLGLISASLLVLVKRGDPINWLIGQVCFLLGGVLFPIEILPNWLRSFSYILPITYSLRGIRHALIEGWTLKSLMPDLLILSAFSVIIFPIGLWVCSLMIRRAKETGTLAHY
ncbi:MAG: ABC transporter permease [Candidatus Kappaea frigidicola]|nr:ABC transporter permease [Candidatus Kappaea frigidicola]